MAGRPTLGVFLAPEVVFRTGNFAGSNSLGGTYRIHAQGGVGPFEKRISETSGVAANRTGAGYDSLAQFLTDQHGKAHSRCFATAGLLHHPGRGSLYQPSS